MTPSAHTPTTPSFGARAPQSGRLVRLARFAGWLVILGFVGALWFERSGLLRSTIDRELKARLGVLGEDLRIGRMDVRWLEPAIELTDLSLGREGEVMFLERCRVDLTWSLVPHVESLTLSGGHVRLSPSLLDAIRGLMSGGESGPSTGSTGEAGRLPAVFVRGLDLELEQPDRPALALGLVDVDLESEEGSPAVLRGRVVPAVSGALAPSQGIFLTGTEPEPGRLSVTAFGRNLPLTLQGLEPESLPPELLRLRPHARFALSAGANVSFASDQPTEGSARIAIDDGFIEWPTAEVPVQDLQLQLQLRYRSTSSRYVFDPKAWHGRGRISARWRDAPLAAGLEIGDAAGVDGAVEAYIRADELPFDSQTVDALGNAKVIADLQDALGFSGRGSVRIGVRAPQGLDLESPIEPQLELMLKAGSNGNAGLAFHGFKEGQGFPYPARDVRGHVLYHRRPDRARRMLVSLVDLEASHASDGPVSAFGVIASPLADPPADAPKPKRITLHLFIRAEDVLFDSRLRRCFDSFQSVLPDERIMDVYTPTQGRIDLDLALWQEPQFTGVAPRVKLDLERTDLTWSPLPVPMRGIDGRFEYVGEGFQFADRRGNWRIDFEGVGHLQTAERIALEGHFQRDDTADGNSGVLGMVGVEGRRLSLTGGDTKILQKTLEAVANAEEWLSPRGFVDVDYLWTRPLPRGAQVSTAEITPAGPLVVRPQKFQMLTRDLVGRVLTTTVVPFAGDDEEDVPASPARTGVLVWPMTGTWGGGVEVASLTRFDSELGGNIGILGAGIDASDGSFLGSLGDAIRARSDGESRFQSDAFQLEGKVDFLGDIALAAASAPDEDRNEESEEEPSAGRYRFHTRDCTFRTEKGFALDDLRGRFTFEDGKLRGDEIDARLGRTPVRLENTEFDFGQGAFELETDIAARNLPLDPEHLGTFLDPETLKTLSEDLDWRGTIDIDSGHLRITGDGSGELRRRFSGDLTLTNVFLRIGLPWSIRSARARVEELVFEGDTVRGWGRLEDLYGQIIDRNLGPATLQVSYYDKHLTIEELDGRFEGGTLRSLAAGRALSIDLEAPFPFELGLSLGADGSGADVGALLKGLFPSNIADRGFAFGNLRLAGDLERIGEIRGNGNLRVRETLLWSIPVIRDLFVTLGLDETAAQFDSFETAFEIADGAIDMRDIDVESDILHLVGDGSLGLDGSLDYRFQLQYGLVNKLGPLRQLLYWIQNNLLSIRIRGDMARPEVSLRSLFSVLFGDGWKRAHLPLPDLSELPERF